MSRPLLWGTLLAFSASSAFFACGESSKAPPFVPWVPVPNSDAGADAGLRFDGGNQDADGESDGDPGFDATVPRSDSGQPGGDGDGGESLDGSLGADAALADDGSVAQDGSVDPDSGPSDDAGRDGDAGSASDAGAEDDDAGGERDGGAESDAGSCGVSGLVAGNNCPGVVSCQDNNGSNVPVFTCELSTHNCCVETSGANASNSCRTDACSGLFVEEAACDGPEDCSNGQRCCFNGGATSCDTSCNNNASRLCHTNADCPSGVTCKVGRVELGTLVYEWWGFCRP